MVKFEKNNLALDNWGIGVSIFCSIHCVLMPVLILSSAIVGWQIERLEELESPLFIAAAIIGLVSIFHAYFNTKRIMPVWLLLAGLVLIITGGFVESVGLEPALRVMGSLLIVLAHMVNKKSLK